MEWLFIDPLERGRETAGGDAPTHIHKYRVISVWCVSSKAPTWQLNIQLGVCVFICVRTTISHTPKLWIDGALRGWSIDHLPLTPLKNGWQLSLVDANKHTIHTHRINREVWKWYGLSVHMYMWQTHTQHVQMWTLVDCYFSHDPALISYILSLNLIPLTLGGHFGSD